MSKSDITTFPFPWATIEEIAAPRLGAIKIGPFGSQLKKEELSQQGYKVYGQENVIADDFSIGDRHVDVHKFAQLQSCRLSPGDIVLTMMGTVGHCAVFPADAEDGIMDSHLLRIQVNPEMADQNFMALVIGSEEVGGRQITRMSHGSIMSGLSSSIVRRLRVPLPPLPEQRRIVEILDAADEAIRQAERLMAKLRAAKAGLLADLLTRGLDKHGHLRDPQAHPEQFKDSPLGRIPKEWEVGDVSIFLQKYDGIKPGPFGSSITKSMYTSEGYRVYGQEQVIAGSLSVGDYYIPQSRYLGLQSFAVQKGDLLISLVGTIGQVLVVRPPFESGVINPRLVRLRPDPAQCDVEFLKHLLVSAMVRSQLAQVAQGGTMPVLSGIVLRRLTLVRPPLKEQSCIAAILDAYDARIRAEEAMLAKLRQVKRGLMDDLLTGQVRVGG